MINSRACTPGTTASFSFGDDVASVAALTDPAQQIAFSLYNDHLFGLVIDYEHDRTEGLADADPIEAISATYGGPVAPF